MVLSSSLLRILALFARTAIPLLIVFWPSWFGASSAAPVVAGVQAADEPAPITLAAGESVVLKVADTVRVAVAEPKVADVAAISRDQVLVSARTVGKTTLHIWDANGLASYAIEVRENSEPLVAALKQRLGLPDVEIWMHQGTVVLEGWVETAAQKERAVQVAGAYGKVVDLLSVRPRAAEAVAPGPQVDEQLAHLHSLIGEPELVLQVVNGTLLLSGAVRDTASRDRALRISSLYYPQVVDATVVRPPEQGVWPVEVYRVTDKAVVQVGM